MSEKLNPIPPNDRFIDLYCKQCGEPVPFGQGYCFDCMPKSEPSDLAARPATADELKAASDFFYQEAVCPNETVLKRIEELSADLATWKELADSNAKEYLRNLAELRDTRAERDKLQETITAYGETRAEDGQCFWCGRKTNIFSSDPRFASVWFPENEPGVMKCHCMGCVTDRLAERDNLKAICGELAAKLNQHAEIWSTMSGPFQESIDIRVMADAFHKMEERLAALKSERDTLYQVILERDKEIARLKEEMAEFKRCAKWFSDWGDRLDECRETLPATAFDEAMEITQSMQPTDS